MERLEKNICAAEKWKDLRMKKGNKLCHRICYIFPSFEYLKAKNIFSFFPPEDHSLKFNSNLLYLRTCQNCPKIKLCSSQIPPLSHPKKFPAFQKFK